MTKNMGTIDRLARAAIGAALIAWALTGGPWWAWVGIVPLFTAAVAICPAYSLLGIKTCPLSKA